MASEVRRRKNAQKPASSIPSSSFNDDNGSGVLSEGKKRPRQGASIEKSMIINSKYDEYAWFIVFLTALTYFIITRGGNSSRGGLLSKFSKPYDVVASSVSVGTTNKQENEKLLKSIFYVANTQRQDDDEQIILTLEHNRRLEVILSSPPDIIESFHGDDECIGSNDKDNNGSKQQPVPYLSHLSSTTWVHDEELGRGYLLLADVGRSGRIWRWEVGGGPITIGRSLHMERSGCRSGLWVDYYEGSGKEGGGTNNATVCPENLFGKSTCSKTSLTAASDHPPLLGSASLAVELTRNADRASAGQHIIVAEWGERRIVRVEGESGARTPLVTQVPYQSNGEEGHEQPQWRRVFRPNHLMYTPFGDLLFSDNLVSDTLCLNNNISMMSNHHVGVVYRRKEAVHIPGIAVEQSRDAHGWKSTTGEEDDVGDDNIDILFQTTGVIDGMALGFDYSTVFILVTSQTNDQPGWTKTVYKLSISAEDDDDEDNDGDNVEEDENYVTILYRMTSTDCKDNHAGDARHDDLYSSSGSKLAIDEKGTLYLIACPSSLTLLSQEDGSVVGTLSLDHLQKTQTTTYTSVSFGEDGYLYITTPNELMRVKSRVGGMSLPTDMVVPPPLKQIGKEDEEDQGSKPR